MIIANVEDIRFLTRLHTSLAKERAAKDRARRDMARTARAHVQCRITILSEYKRRRDEEPPKGA